MGIRVLLIILALVGLMYFAAWLRKASPSQRRAGIRNILIYGAAVTLLILVVTGRLHWLFALLGAAAPWLQRAMMARSAWNSFKAFRGPAKGRQSSVNTAWLAMTLDHDSGDIDGEILAGAFKGSKLSDLGFEQLFALLEECRANDPQSTPLVEAYLDRSHGPEWRGDDAREQAPPGATPQMTRQEAFEILGLEEGADRKAILDAHRRLMQKMHPDRGGSAYLAARINRARDLLLNES